MNKGSSGVHKQSALSCAPFNVCVEERAGLFYKFEWDRRLRPEGVQGASGKPPARGMIRQLCRNQFPVGGRVGFDIPWVSRQLRCPKVSKGRAESPLVRPQAHPPCRGIDAPTPAREWDLPSHGALTLFFRWRKKSVQKKASGTATTKTAHVAARRGLRPAVAPSGLSSAAARCAHPPEKGSYCPFCRRGSQCRAQWSWTVFTFSWSALVLAFFRRQNGRAFFPSLPIAALLPRSWRWADSNGDDWDG